MGKDSRPGDSVPLAQAAARKRALRARLLAWYAGNKRDLPWRRTKDPYRVWVSEVLLQQTRVEGALPYYERFVERFPTLEALAAASEDRVLKAWEGLGYYARARNLLLAARLVVNERGGVVPRTAREWLTLPGVGRYTAGAIASVCFGDRAPILDGNVKRVLSRLFAIREPIEDSATVALMWNLADLLVPPGSPGDFNQAIMELGATVCTPRQPKCDVCPVVGLCEARQQGVEKRLPVRRPKRPVPHVEIAVGVIEKDGMCLMGRRRPKGLLGGLWEFPGGKIEAGETPAQAIKREIQEELRIEVNVGELITIVEHAYSHFTIRMHVIRCEYVSGTPQAVAHSHLRWVKPEQIRRLAIPAANLKFVDLLLPAKSKR